MARECRGTGLKPDKGKSECCRKLRSLARPMSDRHRKQNHKTRDTQDQADSVGSAIHDFFVRNLVGWDRFTVFLRSHCFSA